VTTHRHSARCARWAPRGRAARGRLTAGSPQPPPPTPPPPAPAARLPSRHTQQLHAELDATAEASGPETRNTYAFLPGGGVRAINPGPELGLSQSETCFVVLKGCARQPLGARGGGRRGRDSRLRVGSGLPGPAPAAARPAPLAPRLTASPPARRPLPPRARSHLSNRPALIVRVGGGEASPDAELLRLMYEKYGVDMLGRIEGHFAFCLYDSKLVGLTRV
jgi:hypothetical protein